MANALAIARRELYGYFVTPVAYVFIAIFLFLAGIFTFSLSGLYETRQADLGPFFGWHPWLYLFLVPAISMRLWAEERRSGTIELLLTLPVTLTQAILGKFLAAWAFVAVALALTFPVAVTVAILGDPDSGVVVAGYLGSLLMAGAYLAIGCCISAMTRNQVIAFVIAVSVTFLFMVASFPVVIDWFTGWAPQWLVDAVTSLSFSAHFSSIQRGVIELNDVVFFLSMIGLWLYAAAIVLEVKKAD